MSLITTIAELKQYIHIDDNAKIKTFQKFIDEAEEQYIVDLLGKDFYEEFLALYIGSVVPTDPLVPLSDENKKLLPYIQRSLAYYAQFLSIDQIGVTYGELGLREHNGDDSRPTDRVKTEKLQLTALKKADQFADKLLTFLEDNATADNDYATWFENANTKNSGFIIYSTAIASKHIDISESRRLFLKLRPKLREFEKRLVPKLIGQDQYDEIVAELKAGTLSDPNRELTDLLEPIICRHALYIQLPFLTVSIATDGLWLYSEFNQLRDRWFLADDDAEDELRCQLKDGEFGYIADERKLRAFVLENIEDYPLIKASAIYTIQPVPGPTFVPKNDPWNKHFIG